MSQEYQSDAGTQFALLALYVRRPKRVAAYIQPQYFPNEVHMEIARVVQSNRAKHPHDRISKATLRTLVKQELGKRRADLWPMYKKTISKIFADRLDARDTMTEIAQNFARERESRAALVKAEEYLNVGDFDRFGACFDKLRAKFRPKQTTGEAKLPSYLLHQFLAQEDAQDTNDLVQHIVPKQGATLVYGLPKELKSWLGLQLAIDVAAGHEKALDYFPVPRAARVLYIQVEDRDPLTRERLAMVTQSGSLRRYRTLTNLRIVPRCGLNLSDQQWVALLKQEIKKYKPELVIMDVFRRLFHGNPSAAEEVAAFVRVLDDLRDTHGCAIVLVHHSRKSSEGEMQAKALGSVNLTGWAEALLFTHSKRKAGLASVATLEITTKSFVETMELVVDAESEPVVRVQAQMDAVALLERVIAENPGILQNKLHEKTNIPIKRLREALKDGAQRGLWREEQAKGPGNRLAYYPPK